MRLTTLFTLVSVILISACRTPVVATDTASEGVTTPPNILLVVFEDMSQRIGAFGDPVATTPVLDAFASQSVIYPNTFTTAGVCAPSRAALITGVHQQTLGAQHMRTHAFGTEDDPAGFSIGYSAVPPEDVKAFPELLRRAGYYTFTGYGGWVISNKKDYQFGAPFTVWDADSVDASWRGRSDDQPFFGMITLATTHESFLYPEAADSDDAGARSIATRNARLLDGKQYVTDPDSVVVPAWLPDTPEVRAEIATHYDNIAFTEQKLTELLEALEADGLANNTFVIVTTDHGDGFPRAKRTVFDSGIRVPLMIRFPDLREAGVMREDLISFVDIAPTLLALAGADRPDWLQGRVFLGPEREEPNEYVFASSDRMDAWTDRVKAIRSQRFKLIRNYIADVPLHQPVAFREPLRSMRAMRDLLARDELAPIPQSYFETPRPDVELYDLDTDPEETINLAAAPEWADVRARLEREMDDWLARTADWSSTDEADMVDQFWPGGIQPETGASLIEIEPKTDGIYKVQLSPSTPGASLAWRIEEEGGGEAWKLYVSPLTFTSGACVTARAVRYGYRASPVVSVCLPDVHPSDSSVIERVSSQ